MAICPYKRKNVINYREKYKRLLSEFERLGGNLQGVSHIYSLENEAKLRREMSKLGATQSSQMSQIGQKSQPKEENTPLIIDYPPALHPIYLAKKNYWLRACSLKLALNALLAKEEEKARNLQQQLWQLFEEMDTCDAVLNHWTKYKRILTSVSPLEGAEGGLPDKLQHLSPIQLVQRLHTLRSNIVSREKSLKKWREQATYTVPPLEGEGGNFTLQEKILRKTEELEQMKLLVKKIEKKVSEVVPQKKLNNLTVHRNEKQIIMK